LLKEVGFYLWLGAGEENYCEGHGFDRGPQRQAQAESQLDERPAMDFGRGKFDLRAP
jgi:hypothetical protein